MKGFEMRLCFCIFLSFIVFAPSFSQAKPVGAGDRLFVTKCYPAHGKETEKDFEQLADAGFTVAVSNWAEDDLTYSKRAAKVGLNCMTFMMGMTEATTSDQTITRQGKATRFVKPWSRAGWKEITDVVLEKARLSTTNQNYKGVILDFEIYGERGVDGYCESYDEESLSVFLKSIGKSIPVPMISPENRWQYLNDMGCLGMFIDYQRRHIESCVKEMRSKIDAVNPEFQVGVYGWGVFIETVIKNLSTPMAPGLDLSAVTYGRTIYNNAFDGGHDSNEPDRRGLKWSLTTMAKEVENSRSRDFPVTVLGGHYPQSVGPVNGTGSLQYKFTVRQAFNSAAYADGYWIWTDWTPPAGLDKEVWINDMMAYFKEANAALDEGDFTWSNRQADQVVDSNAQKPMWIMTSDGQKTTVWNPISGKKMDGITAAYSPASNVALDRITFNTAGDSIELIDAKTNVVVRRLSVGHGTRGIAVGEVDGIAGEEIITLNAGWVKIWDIETGTMLLRFYVGTDQVFICVKSPE
jgi:hypothetical protein